jgi:hypothetical protein
LPKVATATAAGNKSLLDAIEKAWDPNPFWFSESYRGLGSEAPNYVLVWGNMEWRGRSWCVSTQNIPKLLTWGTFNVPLPFSKTFGIRFS